jgi:hypothetical protein
VVRSGVVVVAAVADVVGGAVTHARVEGAYGEKPRGSAGRETERRRRSVTRPPPPPLPRVRRSPAPS